MEAKGSFIEILSIFYGDKDPISEISLPPKK